MVIVAVLRSAAARPLRQVVVLDQRRRRPVAMALPFNEGPNDISGYPGSSLFTVTFLRRDDLPTRFVIGRTEDYAPLPTTSLTFWSQFNWIANTDTRVSVAWISPLEYVVPVEHRSLLPVVDLRLFRVTCEYAGSHVVYHGTDLDSNSVETPWPLLPAGSGAVLALGAAEAQAVFERSARTARWLRVDVRSGAVQATRARWRPGGWWTFVQPPSGEGVPRTTEAAACNKYRWRYP
jgi:hypothetical protein